MGEKVGIGRRLMIAGTEWQLNVNKSGENLTF